MSDKAGQNLAALIDASASDGLSPLLVQLYVRRAIELVASGESLASLPASIPDVYVDYVRRAVGAGSHPRASEVVSIAKELAWLSVRHDFAPREVLERELVDAMPTQVREAAHENLERLVISGVVLRKASGLGTSFRIKMDPIAECLAAIRFGETSGADESPWHDMAERLASAGSRGRSFQMMLTLCCEAYGERLRWGCQQMQKPSTAHRSWD